MRVSIACAWAITQAASKASVVVHENRMCLIIDASWIGCRFSSLHLLDIARFPAFVNRCLGRAVEPQNREIAFAWHRPQPVALLARGRFWAEIQLGRAIGVRRWLVARAERGEWLAVGETRRVLGFIECHRPEVGGRDVRWEIDAVVRTA